MKKWYRKSWVKAVCILVSTAAVLTTALSFVLMLGSQGEAFSKDIFSETAEGYEDTETFNTIMDDMSTSVLNQIVYRTNFETDGKFNPDKLVDIMEYYENGKISGKNISGLAYKLGDLDKWSEKYNRDDCSGEDNIIVCEKPDNSYYYYHTNDFLKLLKNGKVKILLDGVAISADNNISEEYSLEHFEEIMINSYSLSDYYGAEIIDILDEKGNILYKDCWGWDQYLEEMAVPDGGESLLEIVNNSPELNGQLEKVYRALEYALGDISYVVNEYRSGNDFLTEGNTNFHYLFVDKTKKKVYTNVSQYREYENAEKNIQTLKKEENNKYVIVQPKLADFETNVKTASAGEWRGLLKQTAESDDYIFVAAVDTNYPIQDIYYSASNLYRQYSPALKSAGAGFVAGIILFIVSLVILTVGAGRKPEDEEIHLNKFDKWKTELGAGISVAVWAIPTLVLGSNWRGVGYNANYVGLVDYESMNHNQYYMFHMTQADTIVIVLYSIFTAVCFLIGYLSLVRRIKGKTLWKNSILYSIVRFIKEFWQNRSVTIRTTALFAVFVAVHWMAIATQNGFMAMLMFAVEAVAGYLLIRSAIAKDKIRKGIREIASGDVNYQIPTNNLKGENLEMAELVNDIGNGLQRAVEEGVKSERLKTDLITNVSHDIKTPLTSIINYVDLLKRENIEDPKIQGYLDVLEAKAQRLKVLTEDVVEASKVSSGNIKLEYMNVNLVEMLNQTIGEFSEKMHAQNLQVVAEMPEEPMMIHVDGRRMWRVLENIFNNAAKYAMPGTRVYADLYTENDLVKFSLKNISAQQLNIKAEELTERFIRGDVSRSTEGSGLGLSIARTLTEMQGGVFELYLDGDLFKVMIQFPRIKE